MKERSAYLFPGQGVQHPGMGDDYLGEFPDLVAQADEILGYSLAELCRDGERLSHTEFAQPALYVISVLDWLKRGEPKADFLAGHSLGEYSALFAGGAVTFETGLRAVIKRGELMATAGEGGMAAAMGLSRQDIEAVLKAENAADTVVVANHNSQRQLVLSGASKDVLRVLPALSDAGASRAVPLKVKSAFHSPAMKEAGIAFAEFLETLDIHTPKIPVVGNVTARPHETDPATIRARLAEHFTAPVAWYQTIQWLRAQAVTRFEPLGPGSVLAGLQREIETDPVDLSLLEADNEAARLGSAAFRRDHGVRLAYVGGAMYRGIASTAIVKRMANAGLLSFFGTAGLPTETVAEALRDIRRGVPENAPWGMNLLPDHREAANVELFLNEGVCHVEAAAYVALTPAIVRYRLSGLEAAKDGTVTRRNRLMAKVSRPEVAERFLSPAPEEIIGELLAAGTITEKQAELATQVPMADDLCAEADSGGHTDSKSPYALLPAMLALRDRIQAIHHFDHPTRVGSAGGIGTPEAAAAAFTLGADFIVTGSVNQCTVEAGTSDAVKDLLREAGVQDTAYAPSGNYFESGARVQVLRRGVLFPARANRLYELYRTYESIEALPPDIRSQIEDWFNRSLDDVWQDCLNFWDEAEIARAQASPKHRMALIFRWYFGYTTRLALTGEIEQQVNFQIHCGPALGAFNAWLDGTSLADWRRRHVDTNALLLMRHAADMLKHRWSAMATAEE